MQVSKFLPIWAVHGTFPLNTAKSCIIAFLAQDYGMDDQKPLDYTPLHALCAIYSKPVTGKRPDSVDGDNLYSDRKS
jgi:hypothetical protein